MPLSDIEAALEQVKNELAIHAIYSDERGKYFLGAVERVVSIALDQLSIVKAHEESRERESVPY